MATKDKTTPEAKTETAVQEQAQTAVQSIPKDFSEDVEERLRYALQFFSA